MADAAKIVELADKHNIAGDDRESLVSFALGYSDGVRSADSTVPVHLYGLPVSPNVLPVWILLEAAGIPYEFKPVDLLKGEHLAESFLSMNPYHTVPTIKHGDFCLHEGSSIMRYLTRAFPTAAGKFYGNGDAQAQAVIDCALDVRLGKIYNLVAPVLGSFVGFKPKFSEEEVKAHGEALSEGLQKFVDHFVKTTPFVGGDNVSIADISVGAAVLAVLAMPPFAEFVPQSVQEWAAPVQKAVPADKVLDGATNGLGFGAKQFIGMRAASYEATEVGKPNTGQ